MRADSLAARASKRSRTRPIPMTGSLTVASRVERAARMAACDSAAHASDEAPRKAATSTRGSPVGSAASEALGAAAAKASAAAAAASAVVASMATTGPAAARLSSRARDSGMARGSLSPQRVNVVATTDRTQQADHRFGLAGLSPNSATFNNAFNGQNSNQ